MIDDDDDDEGELFTWAWFLKGWMCWNLKSNINAIKSVKIFM